MQDKPIEQPSKVIKSSNLQSQVLNNKIKIVTLTFLAFVGIHALRTTYSFSKSYLPNQINVQAEYIGLVDSIMLLFLGIGNFYIAIVPIKKPVLLLWVMLILCGAEYALVPLSMSVMTGLPAFLLLLILMGLSGFLQSFAWPNLLVLVHTVATPDKDGALLGFWTTSANFGNIFGFLICQAFVFGLGLDWQIGMLFIALFLMVIGISIGTQIEQIPQIQNVQTVQSPLLSESLQSSGFQEPKISKIFKSPRITLLTICFSLLKSVMQGSLLWLPVYFHTIGLVDYELYIPMAFDGASIIGSVFLGAIFKTLEPKNKNTAMLPLMILLVGFFLLLRIVDLSIFGYFFIISCVGFCVGGSYNMMAGLVTMELVRVIPKQMQSKCLRFYSALLMGVACFVTSITQVIIGLTVQKNIDALFGIFLIYTMINFGCLAGVVYIDRQSFSVVEQAQLAAIGIVKIESKISYTNIQIVDSFQNERTQTNSVSMRENQQKYEQQQIII